MSVRLVSLNRARERAQRRERDQVSTQLKTDARDFAAEDIDGYALVVFQRNGNSVQTRATWYVRDPIDQYALPELCRERISRSLYVNHEREPDADPAS